MMFSGHSGNRVEWFEMKVELPQFGDVNGDRIKKATPPVPSIFRSVNGVVDFDSCVRAERDDKTGKISFGIWRSGSRGWQPIFTSKHPLYDSLLAIRTRPEAFLIDGEARMVCTNTEVSFRAAVTKQRTWRPYVNS